MAAEARTAAVPHGPDFVYINAQVVNSRPQVVSGLVIQPSGTSLPPTNQFYVQVLPGMTWPRIGWTVDLRDNLAGSRITNTPPYTPSNPATFVTLVQALDPVTHVPVPVPMPPAPDSPVPPLPSYALITMSLPWVTDPTEDWASIFLAGATNAAIPFSYIEQRQNDVVRVAEDYVVSVESFRLPTTLIPLFPCPTTGLYLGTMRFMSISSGPVFTKSVVVAPDNLAVTPFGVYFYQTVLNGVNAALNSLYQLTTLSTGPPQILLDETSGLFSLYAPQGQYVPDTSASYTIQMSPGLYYLFNSLPATVVAGSGANEVTQYNLTVINEGDNAYIAEGKTSTGGGLPAGNYWQMSQQTTSLAEWSQFESIVVTSALPTHPENLPGAASTVAGESLDPSRASNPGNTNLRQTLIDWQPNSGERGFDRSPAVYARGLVGLNRYVALTSKAPIRDLTVYAWWQDRRLRLYPLLIPNDEYGSVKLQLRSKRSLGIYKAANVPTDVYR